MLRYCAPWVLLCATLSAQEPTTVYDVPGTNTKVGILSSGDQLFSAVSRDAGRTWRQLNELDTQLHLRFGTFDPTRPPMIPTALQSGDDCGLFLVQFQTQIVPEFRAAIRGFGATLHQYLPSQSYLVRMDGSTAGKVRALPFVRSVGAYHKAFRLDPALIMGLGKNPGAQRYLLTLVDKRLDARGVEARAAALGATNILPADGGLIVDVTMTEAGMLSLANDPGVQWIEAFTNGEVDIDNARIQGGVNYIETQAGIDGKGMTGHVMEGVHATHTEFAAIPGVRSAPIAPFAAASSSHGTNTAGEIYARGVNPTYRGLLPNAQCVYTNYSYVINTNQRYNVTQTLISRYDVMMDTASWGYSRTTDYTSRSAEMDDIIFDQDIFITQSQSNAGSTSDPRNSRPQAWAKNITSVGGFRHGNNANASDDYWGRSGSTGPAADGRIGVTLSAYYDSIGTTSGSTGYTNSFGGTSGATPIVNGLGGNMIEMFTDGLFGYGKAASETAAERKKFLPHFSTTKALLVATASQLTYNATGVSVGANRYQQGFGFPNLRRAYNERNRMLVIDELDVLTQGQSRNYFVFAKGGRLNVAMNYPDPAASPSAAIHRINSVDLTVTTSNGNVYRGNNGLLTGPASTTGGSANDRDTEEAVLLPNAPAGLTLVTVRATAVRQDGHRETRVNDIDFGLVVDGSKGNRDTTGLALDLESSAPGDLTVTVSNLPNSGWDEGFTLFSAVVNRPVSTGDVFGLEYDGIARSILREPIGSVFHFASGVANRYPRTPYSFPTPFIAALQGVTFDGVVMLLNNGEVVDVSNVDRVTIR